MGENRNKWYSRQRRLFLFEVPKPRTVAPGIGARIESLASEWGTLTEFAAELGVSDRTLGNYIRGDREPSFDVLVKIRRVTGVDINWLLTGEEGGGRVPASGQVLGAEDGSRPRGAPAHRLDPVILSRVSRLVAAAHKSAAIRLPPEALVREVGALYNEMLERVDDPTDAAELMALLPWAEARLKKRLAEAVARPGSGKRSA